MVESDREGRCCCPAPERPDEDLTDREFLRRTAERLLRSGRPYAEVLRELRAAMRRRRVP